MSSVLRFVSQGRLPHLLFYGPPGTGKTSTALALATAIFGGGSPMAGHLLELNASDERGIDVIREQIKTFAATRSFGRSTAAGGGGGGQFKLIILDECDAMTSAAQNALRRGSQSTIYDSQIVSDGKVCPECAVHSDLQLRQPADSCFAISMHPLPFLSLDPSCHA